MHPDNLESRKRLYLRHISKVSTGACYLGVFIGDNESKYDWLKYFMLIWERNIITIRKTAGKYPQESYAAVVHAIQY